MEFILDFDYDKSVVELYTESLANTFTDEGRLSGRKWVGEQIENRLYEVSKTRSKNGYDILGILKIKIDGRLAGLAFPREVTSKEYGEYDLNPINVYYRLSGIFIHPDFRGQGLAFKILQWFIDEKKYVLWTADTENNSSIRVAEKADLKLKSVQQVFKNDGQDHAYDLNVYVNK